jgi:hypothetical protein
MGGAFQQIALFQYRQSVIGQCAEGGDALQSAWSTGRLVMSATVTAPAWEMALETRTVGQFLRAVGVAFTAVGVGCLIYAVEKFGVQAKLRCVENPADVMVRVLGMAHFVVGWLYLVSSPKLRNANAIARLSVATAIGIVVCALFAIFGGTRHPLLAMVFYGYFLFHEITDETMIYQAYGNNTSRTPEEAAFLRTLSWAAATALFAALASAYFGFALAENHKMLRRLPEGFAPVAIGCLGAIALVALVRVGWLGVPLYGSVRRMVAAHLPLFLVYGGLLAILILGSLLGTTGLNFIILIHVSVWMVFIHHQLGKRPARSRGGLWTWLRATPTGFLVLHIGVAIGFLTLMAIRVYVWQRTGLVSDLLAGRNFCYWGLMHISMSLWNGR